MRPIPDGVPNDPSVHLEEHLAHLFPPGVWGGQDSRISTVRLLARDGVPYLVYVTIGAPRPLTSGMHAYALAALAMVAVSKHGLRPAGDEATLEIEDMDGHPYAHACMRLVASPWPSGVEATTSDGRRVSPWLDLYDLAGQKVATFPSEEPPGHAGGRERRP